MTKIIWAKTWKFFLTACMYVCTECMIDVFFYVFVAVRMLMLMLLMETAVFQNSELYYFSFSCFISKLSSNRESVFTMFTNILSFE